MKMLIIDDGRTVFESTRPLMEKVGHHVAAYDRAFRAARLIFLPELDLAESMLRWPV